MAYQLRTLLVARVFVVVNNGAPDSTLVILEKFRGIGIFSVTVVTETVSGLGRGQYRLEGR
jgi:hypothetical protein